MSDLCLEKTDRQDFDLAFKGGDLVLSDSLQMSVILSIACWCRDVPYDGAAILEPSIGGWWADAMNEMPIGSRLWTLFRSKLTTPTLKNAESLIKDALKWMVDDGVAKDVKVSSGNGGKHTAWFIVEIVKPNGDTEQFKYETNWEASF